MVLAVLVFRRYQKGNKIGDELLKRGMSRSYKARTKCPKLDPSTA